MFLWWGLKINVLDHCSELAHGYKCIFFFFFFYKCIFFNAIDVPPKYWVGVGSFEME